MGGLTFSITIDGTTPETVVADIQQYCREEVEKWRQKAREVDNIVGPGIQERRRQSATHAGRADAYESLARLEIVLNKENSSP